MRIAIVNWSNREVGGAEKYLARVIPELERNGHALALLHGTDAPADRDRIALPRGAECWCIEGMGAGPAAAALERWGPDVLFLHSAFGGATLKDLVARFPAVFLCHDFVGTCISGLKTLQFPIVQPCDRRFGWPCLAYYFPRRCGGWSPATMWTEFRKQSERLELLRGCRAIVTVSDFMRREYLKHGFEPGRVHHVPYAHGELARKTPSSEPSRLLFAGRMERLKGGGYLLEALPLAMHSLGRPLRAVFAGDGRMRAEWEGRARALGLPVEFTGWLDESQMSAQLDSADLAVVPSVWPEPFGLIGLEAARRGVPAAAFRVGGVSDWLEDGVNGFLAPGDPPTAAGLADAIARCLRDPAMYWKLCAGAYAIGGRFARARPVERLTRIFEEAIRA